MIGQDIAKALEQTSDAFRRRPEAATDDDSPALASWQGGLSMVASHPNGQQVATDMPGEFGGGSSRVTPGWLLRAGVASCAATSIVMAAAQAGIELAVLEVRVGSRSDARGMLGMPDADGRPVHAGPFDMQMSVRIGAGGVSEDRLRSLVDEAVQRSPVPAALCNPTPLALRVEVQAG